MATLEDVNREIAKRELARRKANPEAAAKSKGDRVRQKGLTAAPNEDQQQAMKDGSTFGENVEGTWAGIKQGASGLLGMSPGDVAGVGANANQGVPSLSNVGSGIVNSAMNADKTQEDKIKEYGKLASPYEQGFDFLRGLLPSISREQNPEIFDQASIEENTRNNEAGAKAPLANTLGMVGTMALPAMPRGQTTVGGAVRGVAGRVGDTAKAFFSGGGSGTAGLVDRAVGSMDAARGVIRPGEGAPNTYGAYGVTREGLPGQAVKPPPLPVEARIPDMPRVKGNLPQQVPPNFGRNRPLATKADLPDILGSARPDEVFSSRPTSAPAFDISSLEMPTKMRLIPSTIEDFPNRVNQVNAMHDDITAGLKPSPQFHPDFATADTRISTPGGNLRARINSSPASTGSDIFGPSSIPDMPQAGTQVATPSSINAVKPTELPEMPKRPQQYPEARSPQQELATANWERAGKPTSNRPVGRQKAAAPFQEPVRNLKFSPAEKEELMSMPLDIFYDVVNGKITIQEARSSLGKG